MNLKRRICAVAVAYAAPASPGFAKFAASLDAANRARFSALSSKKQAVVIAALSDPLGASSKTKAQFMAKYPGATETDSAGVSSTPVAIAAAHPDSLARPSYTTYSVHSWFNHSESIWFVTNTATIDYYDYTGNGQVLSDNYCTWHDTGFSLDFINNISVNHWVNGGLGHCYADIQVSWAPYGVINQVVTQQMDVNGQHVYRTYFHETG